MSLNKNDFILNDAKCEICKKLYPRKKVLMNSTDKGEELWCIKCMVQLYKGISNVTKQTKDTCNCA